MDETWGLTWSEKWHAIDPKRGTGSAGINGGRVVSYCGAYLYTQAEVRESRHLHHLKRVLDVPTSAAQCKLCVKKLAKEAAADAAAH